MDKELGILKHSFLRVCTNPIPFDEQRLYRLRFPGSRLPVITRSDLGPPPPDKAPFDRCSIKGHPVMYTSANPSTCFQEVLFIQQETIPLQFGYLSEWKVRSGRKLRMAPFVYHQLPEASDLSILTKALRENVMLSLAKYYDENGIEAVLRTLGFLSEMFISDKHKSISSFIGHSHQYIDHSLRADVLMYPSIQAQHLRTNFAFHPECLDDLELVQVWECAVKDHVPPGRRFDLRWLHHYHGFDGEVISRSISIGESNHLTKELHDDFQKYHQAKGNL